MSRAETISKKAAIKRVIKAELLRQYFVDNRYDPQSITNDDLINALWDHFRDWDVNSDDFHYFMDVLNNLRTEYYYEQS